MKISIAMTRLLFGRAIIAMIACALLLACAPPVPENLPSIPDFSSAGYLPVITQQMDRARESVLQDPHRASSNAHYAMVLHAYEKHEASAVLYDRAILLERKPFTSLYLQSHALEAAGRIDDAIAALQNAHRIRPHDPWASIKLYVMQYSSTQGEPNEALSSLAKLTHSHETLPELHFALGKLHVMNGQFDQAITHYQRCLELVGNTGAVHYALGRAYQRSGSKAEARQHLALSKQYQHVIAQSSDPYLAQIQALNRSDVPLIKQAEFLTKTGQLKKAVSMLNEALKRNPESSVAHISLIGLYAVLGDFDQAERHFLAAKEIAPERAKLHFNLGLLRLTQKRYVEATEAFRQALERDRQNADIYLQLSMALKLQGMKAESRGMLKRALKIDPSNRAARFQLAEEQFASGKFVQVTTLLEGFYEPPDGGSAHALLLLAKAYNKLKQFERAALAAKKGIEFAQVWQQQSLINQFKRQIQLAESG